VVDKPPSQTALTAAAARAAHPVVDQPPFIFVDPLAATLLGEDADEFIDYHRKHGGHPVLVGARTQVTCRSRYTEDRLAASRPAQYVVLGAGLDSFAYRSPLAGRLRTFEVDHPATQEWKRERLAGRIPVPDSLTYVPLDLETDTLAEGLRRNGFDPTRPALVSWLGVTMYLTRAAIAQTLATIGELAPGTEVVLDYMLPEPLRDEAGQDYVDAVAPIAAERGEPWRSFLAPEDLDALLATARLDRVEHVGQHDLIEAAWPDRTDALRPARLTQLVRARVR
jgi:methyltransferase (TIGR00027 family)